jgi:hypothetical protein
MTKENEGHEHPHGNIVDVAETLGTILGTAEAQLTSWMGQRDKVVKDLLAIREKATSLLAQAGHQVQDVAAAIQRGRRGRPPGSKNSPAAGRKAKRGPGRPPKARAASNGRKTRKGGMSAEGRAAVAAAQKARWDKIRAAKEE